MSALQTLDKKGWVLQERLIDSETVADLKTSLVQACEICARYQAKMGLLPQTQGTAHHILKLAPVFEQFLAAGYLHDEMLAFFSGPYILNSFGGVLNSAKNQAYVQNIHRDQRSWSGDFPLMLNMLVLLDDFTRVNGGTWLLTGSHRRQAKPTEDAFYAEAFQLEAPAGSILIFHSLLWHAAGLNQTTEARAGLTLTFSRPWMKPQFDYARQYSAAELAQKSLLFKQLIGYYSRIPAQLDEWYQPPDQRFYRSDQG